MFPVCVQHITNISKMLICCLESFCHYIIYIYIYIVFCCHKSRINVVPSIVYIYIYILEPFWYIWNIYQTYTNNAFKYIKKVPIYIYIYWNLFDIFECIVCICLINVSNISKRFQYIYIYIYDGRNNIYTGFMATKNNIYIYIYDIVTEWFKTTN